jgi:hypothetical protein
MLLSMGEPCHTPAGNRGSVRDNWLAWVLCPKRTQELFPELLNNGEWLLGSLSDIRLDLVRVILIWSSESTHFSHLSWFLN